MKQHLIKAERKDLSEIFTLYKEAINHMINDNIFQWDEIYPNENDLSYDVEKGELYILRENDRIISCIVLNCDQDEEYETGNWKYVDGNVIVIHRLCVHPKAQGRGIGKMTVVLAEDMVRAMGYDIVRLDAFSQNPGARHMYESLGYSYAGEVTFRKGLFYLMEKKL